MPLGELPSVAGNVAGREVVKLDHWPVQTIGRPIEIGAQRHRGAATRRQTSAANQEGGETVDRTDRAVAPLAGIGHEMGT